MGSLVLVRHATTESSMAGRNLGQRTDAPLTDGGRRLAQRAGAAIRAELAALGSDEWRMLSSPALRCRETAGAIAAALALGADSVATDPGLWEIDYGEWEGLTQEECRRRDPQLRAAFDADPYATSTPGGESGADVARRAFAALEPVEEWLRAEPGRAALVVSHNHVVRLRMSALLGLAMADYRRRVRADPGGYCLVTMTAGRTTIRRLNAAPASGNDAAPHL